MNYRILSKHYIMLFFVIALNICAYAQIFERVENIIGLDELEENNGIATADYDNDNDLDIFVVAKAKDDNNDSKTLSRLFRNNNDGSFTDVTLASGITNLFSQQEGIEGFNGLNGFKYGASWGDFNNDDYPDLFLTYLGKVQLWKNMGDGSFINITSSAGFELSDGCGNTTATWLDYDNDGLLDIYIADWTLCPTNSLYKNNGDETFTNVTASTNITSDFNYASYVAFPFDFNANGFLDIYVTNDKSEPNSLYLNSSGTSFSEDANAYGVDTADNDMGLAFGDYNNDGNFDMFITSINNNFLLINDGNNTFNDNADALGVGNTFWSWDARFSDFDLDGDEDLFVVNGYYLSTAEPNFYFKNEYPENSFTNISSQLGFNQNTMSVGINDFDYDNDGDLDLAVTNSDTSIFFYENKLLNFNDNSTTINWFKIKLKGTVSNLNAIGTTLTITTDLGVQKRYNSGIGFLTQSLKPVHFGLNTATTILELKIEWPSGIVESYYNLPINSTIEAIEDQGYTVLNIQPSQKTYGCTDPNSCSYNPLATVDDNSCVFLSTNSISGNVLAQVLTESTYTYTSANSDTTLHWEVTGGEILSGQNTNSITVKWHIEDTGFVTVVETNANCQSLPSTLTVNLAMNNLPANLSVARLWNEVLLDAIRNDYARPTIHARNLFHTSVAMYDIWAIYDAIASPYLIGNTVNGFSNNLDTFVPNEPNEISVKKAISYAMFRLLSHRFQNSPGANNSLEKFQLVMDQLGYNSSLVSVNYQSGDAAALGNYVAQVLIDYGLQDGSREVSDYDNAYYTPINTPLVLDVSNTLTLVNPNRWQPLALDAFIDQSGNLLDGDVPPFLSPEWGNVLPFALSDSDKNSYERDNNTYHVFHDPLSPPQLSLLEDNTSSSQYKWGFSLVSVWQSHLDPYDSVMWNISPGAIGNLDSANLPTMFSAYPNFYNFFEGGINSNGHAINPHTGLAYQPNVVPRGDYTRVLAEFWADGPDSETPPGHWFTILNYVNDNPLLEKRFNGVGEVLNALEWDVKSYFILGGGLHDAAISAWSIKGWYDYIRPISAIRYMAELGQSTDTTLSNYHIGGVQLIDNYIEVVATGDPLAGNNNENVGEIKLYTWRGHDYISDPNTDTAGVGWILAKKWYPYQRPTFVTPPFAGYVSGHSTFSRTAADLLTLITGNEFFPGGLGEFTAKQNEFLVFEEGPTQDITLQWATYRDASDQTSLSRIWGGIHPPADDILGRLIGEKVAYDTFNYAVPYFGLQLSTEDEDKILRFYPNPIQNSLFIEAQDTIETVTIFSMLGQQILKVFPNTLTTKINVSHLKAGTYFVKITMHNAIKIIKVIKQ